MIRLLVSVIVRSAVELALVLVGMAALLGFFAYRLTRRIVTNNPDKLEKLSGPAAIGLAFLARARAAAELDDEAGVHPSDFEYDDEDDRAPAPRVRREPIRHEEWEEMVV